MVDAYRQPYIPFYLTTREFFALVRDRLEPGGVVIVNAGPSGGLTRLEEMLAAGLRGAFPHVDARPDHGVQHAARRRRPRGRRAARAARRAARRRPARAAPCSRRPPARLAPALPGGSVYTDDRAPVEWLIDRSIISYAADQ